MEADEEIMAFLKGDHEKVWTLNEIANGASVELDDVKEVMPLLFAWHRVAYDMEAGYIVFKDSDADAV